MDKVMVKRQQHAEGCSLLAAEGYDMMLLSVVLGSAGILFKCLDRATKVMEFPDARKKKLYSKLHLHSLHTLQNFCPDDDTWTGKSQPQKQGEG